MNQPTYIIGSVQTRAYALLRENVYSVLEKYDITPTYWSMLGIIMEARDGIRQAEVARLMNVKAPLITLMAREMQNRGYVQSVHNQFDARAKLLSVTAQGKKFIKSTDIELQKQLSYLLTGLTENDLIIYQKVLTTIVSNAEKLKPIS
jgi:MarR family transcriptional regulator for hemolysin